eukprot:gene30944-38244_t
MRWVRGMRRIPADTPRVCVIKLSVQWIVTKDHSSIVPTSSRASRRVLSDPITEDVKSIAIDNADHQDIWSQIEQLRDKQCVGRTVHQHMKDRVNRSVEFLPHQDSSQPASQPASHSLAESNPHVSGADAMRKRHLITAWPDLVSTDLRSDNQERRHNQLSVRDVLRQDSALHVQYTVRSTVQVQEGHSPRVPEADVDTTVKCQEQKPEAAVLRSSTQVNSQDVRRTECTHSPAYHRTMDTPSPPCPLPLSSAPNQGSAQWSHRVKSQSVTRTSSWSDCRVTSRNPRICPLFITQTSPMEPTIQRARTGPITDLIRDSV